MPEPKFQIRPVHWPTDEETVMALFDQCDLHHATLVPSVFQPFTQTRSFFQKRTSHPNGILLCAVLEKTIVGCIYFYPREAPPYPMSRPHRYIMIDNLVVHRDYRRQGVGTALMQAVEAQAADMGIQDIRLHVWEANEAALHFYEELGYETLSRNMVKHPDQTNKGDCDE
jgi:ribosomal protein S18 acetylase RimI-like enzyme